MKIWEAMEKLIANDGKGYIRKTNCGNEYVVKPSFDEAYWTLAVKTPDNSGSYCDLNTNFLRDEFEVTLDKPKFDKYFETITINKICYGDFEKFVKKIYPELSKYEFVMAQECNNDTDHEFSIRESDKKSLDKYESDIWTKLINSNGIYPNCNNVLFRKLAIDKYLPVGNYLINVSW